MLINKSIFLGVNVPNKIVVNEIVEISDIKICSCRTTPSYLQLRFVLNDKRRPGMYFLMFQILQSVCALVLACDRTNTFESWSRTDQNNCCVPFPRRVTLTYARAENVKK